MTIACPYRFRGAREAQGSTGKHREAQGSTGRAREAGRRFLCYNNIY